MASSSITRFFVEAFASALEQGIATPDDVLKHATPDVLSRHLPRPIWARLIAACLAAPRTDAKLVVDTITVPDLCEHMPAPVLWACLAEIAQRALGKSLLAMAPAPVAAAVAAPVPAPVPDRSDKTDRAGADKLAQGTSPGVPAVAAATTGSQPIATHVPARAQTEPPAPLGELPPVGSRAPTAKPGVPPARPTTGAMPAVSTTSGGNGLRSTQAGASTRRPQAAATPTATVPSPEPGRERKGPRTAPPSGRRGVTTNSDFELDTDVNEWKATNSVVAPKPEAVVVDDDLVDWGVSEETATGGVDLERKR